MKATSKAIIVIIGALICGCAKKTLYDDSTKRPYEPSDEKTLESMVNGIAAINKNSPGSYSVEFTVDGVSDRKKFKLQGNAQFNRKQRMMHAAFLDYIFNTPVTVFLLEGEAVRILFPIEKKMYVDDARTINLANYGGFSINFDILYDLATGTIPLLHDCRIKQGLIAKEESTTLLILENAGYIETISFNENVPDKILLIDKNTKEKLEIYIKKIIQQGASRFFSSLKIISKENSVSLDITFHRILLNNPVRVKTIKDIKLPENLQIIKM